MRYVDLPAEPHGLRHCRPEWRREGDVRRQISTSVRELPKVPERGADRRRVIAVRTRDQNRRAGRLLLDRIDELAAGREDFGFETTLSGRTYAPLMKGLGRVGDRIVLFFLRLPTADLAMVRVANRVRQGGHAVPESDVRRRYVSGLRNFFHLYRSLASTWWFFEASTLPPVVIARQDGEIATVEQPDLFDQIQKSLGASCHVD
jgi:predicted ABC-type ATPase